MQEYVFFFSTPYCFQIQVDHFLPMFVLFVQQPNTEKQTGNVANVQNGCARTTLTRQFKQHVAIARNNHNTNFMHIPILNCFLVIKKI